MTILGKGGQAEAMVFPFPPEDFMFLMGAARYFLVEQCPRCGREISLADFEAGFCPDCGWLSDYRVCPCCGCDAPGREFESGQCPACGCGLTDGPDAPQSGRRI